MPTFRCAWSMLLIGLLVGCGGGRGSGVKVEPPSPAAMAKAILEDTIAQGNVTSGETLREKLEAMKQTDPAKASELLADYEQLIKLSNAQAIAAKAAQMAAKLPAVTSARGSLASGESPRGPGPSGGPPAPAQGRSGSE